MLSNYEIVPIINDILLEYKSLRLSGNGREKAISAIKEMYSEALLDEDDRVAVMCGISLALCEKKELFITLAQETICEIDAILARPVLNRATLQQFQKIKEVLCDESMLGNEAVYRRQAPYVPDWKIGDLFSHSLSLPKAEELGIDGWKILFYKVGEFLDSGGRYRQLMYVSLCPPGKEPSNSAQLKALGFLRIMNHDKKWDYLVQITPKSRKEELGFELTKIGNIPEVQHPVDRTDENPLVAMPMYGYLKKGAGCPSYEDQICRIYRRFGKYLPKVGT